MATWYVDNEHGGTNAGTQANPFKTLAAVCGIQARMLRGLE